MRIGIVTTWFERGAAYVSRQYRNVLAVEHEVFIYARGGESYAIGDPRWDEPCVTWGRKSSLPHVMGMDLKDFRRWLDATGVQLVFFNEQTWWEPVLMCQRRGLKTGAYIDYYTEKTVPYFSCYDFLICNTRRHASAFDWHSQCFYVPWGTDTQLFTMTSPGPVSPGAVTFFHSGGVSPRRKGCDLVIKSFAALKGRVRLVVHAQQQLKIFFPEIAGLIAELESEGRLQCIEETVSSPGLFHLGDVYVYPTRLEGIGLTILEAAACGLPAIVTGCAPMTEFVAHGVNGRHVAIDRFVARSDGYYWPQAQANIEDLTAQMQWYVDHIDDLRRVKKVARAYAEQHFSWDVNARSVPAIFEFSSKRVAASDAILEEIAGYERRRYVQNRQSMYLRVRSWIEHRYPRIFQIASWCLSRTKGPFRRCSDAKI